MVDIDFCCKCCVWDCLNQIKWILGINSIKCLTSDIQFSTIFNFFQNEYIYIQLYNNDENTTNSIIIWYISVIWWILSFVISVRIYTYSKNSKKSILGINSISPLRSNIQFSPIFHFFKSSQIFTTYNTTEKSTIQKRIPSVLKSIQPLQPTASSFRQF